MRPLRPGALPGKGTPIGFLDRNRSRSWQHICYIPRCGRTCTLWFTIVKTIEIEGRPAVALFDTSAVFILAWSYSDYTYAILLVPARKVKG